MNRNLLVIMITFLLLGSPGLATAQSIKIENCSASERLSLMDSIEKARNWSSRSFDAIQQDYFSDDPNTTYLYSRWFGADPDGNRPRYVRDTYGNVVHFFDRADIKFACVGNDVCDEASAYAISWDALSKNDLWTHVCPSFFSSTENERWSVLIHEMTHFNSVRGTSDYCYGAACRTLAKTRPHEAIRNADNYEKFALELSGLRY